MKRVAGVVVMVTAALASAVERTPADDQANVPTVAAVEVVSDDGEVRGTAVLIRREELQARATLYFLTSARLFRGPDGNYRRSSRAVTLRLDEARILNVKYNDVVAEGSGFVDLAILRATTTDNWALQPALLAYDSPPVNAGFLLSGIDEAGRAKTVAEHVSFRSTLLVVGDRDASALAGCVGAPAITDDGVIGIVRECEAHRSPVVSLLALARPFLERYVPRQTTTHEAQTTRVSSVSPSARRSSRAAKEGAS